MITAELEEDIRKKLKEKLAGLDVPPPTASPSDTALAAAVAAQFGLLNRTLSRQCEDTAAARANKEAAAAQKEQDKKLETLIKTVPEHVLEKIMKICGCTDPRDLPQAYWDMSLSNTGGRASRLQKSFDERAAANEWYSQYLTATPGLVDIAVTGRYTHHLDPKLSLGFLFCGGLITKVSLESKQRRIEHAAMCLSSGISPEDLVNHPVAHIKDWKEYEEQ